VSRRAESRGREWYDDGLRFECTMCGNCCTGPPGIIAFTKEEGERIAARLGLSYDEFYENYTHDTPEGRSLNETLTEHGHDCVFLDRTSDEAQSLRGGRGGGVCTLYEDRPLQCRTFPWWPHTVDSVRSWSQAARGCEGIGRGKLIPVEHIRIERSKQAQRERSGENVGSRER
jgi:Fe-S-cluster containining protein